MVVLNKKICEAFGVFLSTRVCMMSTGVKKVEFLSEDCGMIITAFVRGR